jgi:hypothetical protein
VEGGVKVQKRQTCLYKTDRISLGVVTDR